MSKEINEIVNQNRQKLYKQRNWVEEDCDCRYCYQDYNCYSYKDCNQDCDCRLPDKIKSNIGKCKNCVGWRRRLTPILMMNGKLTKIWLDYKVDYDGNESICEIREKWKQDKIVKSEKEFIDEIGVNHGREWNKEDKEIVDKIKEEEKDKRVNIWKRREKIKNIDMEKEMSVIDKLRVFRHWERYGRIN